MSDCFQEHLGFYIFKSDSTAEDVVNTLIQKSHRFQKAKKINEIVFKQ